MSSAVGVKSGREDLNLRPHGPESSRWMSEPLSRWSPFSGNRADGGSLSPCGRRFALFASVRCNRLPLASGTALGSTGVEGFLLADHAPGSSNVVLGSASEQRHCPVFYTKSDERACCRRLGCRELSCSAPRLDAFSTPIVAKASAHGVVDQWFWHHSIQARVTDRPPAAQMK
jgi:hypothetical protein